MAFDGPDEVDGVDDEEEATGGGFNEAFSVSLGFDALGFAVEDVNGVAGGGNEVVMVSVIAGCG